MKDTKHREEIASARATLKKSSRMLLTTTKVGRKVYGPLVISIAFWSSIRFLLSSVIFLKYGDLFWRIGIAVLNYFYDVIPTAKAKKCQ